MISRSRNSRRLVAKQPDLDTKIMEIDTKLMELYIGAAEFLIGGLVLRWRMSHYQELTSEASNRLFERECLHRLQTGKGTLAPSHIVDLAKAGHPWADHALRHYIHLET